MAHQRMGGQTLPQNHIENLSLLKYSVLILGLGVLAIILLSGLYYVLSSGQTVTLSPTAEAVVGAEQMLSADYVLQTDFIAGRYLLPFLISLLFAGAALFWVLKAHKKPQS